MTVQFNYMHMNIKKIETLSVSEQGKLKGGFALVIKGNNSTSLLVNGSKCSLKNTACPIAKPSGGLSY